MSIETPIACDMTAITAQERKDHEVNAEAVFRSIESIKELSEGYAFRLSSKTDAIIRAGAFIARERLCCPFFHFSLEIEPEKRGVWLKISGGKGVKEYIKESVLPVVKKVMNETG